MVKVTGGYYLGGMPTMDYKIHINGITIGLCEEDFKDLISSLSEKLKEDYEQAIKVKESHNKNKDLVREIREELIKIFWDGDLENFDAFLIRNDVKEIDQKRLFKLLEDNNKFFGFK